MSCWELVNCPRCKRQTMADTQRPGEKCEWCGKTVVPKRRGKKVKVS